MEKSVKVFGDAYFFNSGFAGDDTLGSCGLGKAFFFQLCIHLLINSCVPGYYPSSSSGKNCPVCPPETGFGGTQHLLTPTV